VFNKRRNRRLFPLWVATAALILALSGCASERIITPEPSVPAPGPGPGVEPTPQPIERTLEYDLCEAATNLPEGQRMYQGYEGWFFFRFDLEETFAIFEQATFVEELSRALEAQGVLLVVMPIPGRAVIRPNFIYPGDPKQSSFSPAAADASYAAYVQILQRAGVSVVDVVDAAKAFEASGGQTFFKRDLHWTPEGANAVAKKTAEVIGGALNEPLPTTALQVVRRPEKDRGHRGNYLGDWLYKACGYLLPPEPLRVYEIVRAGGVGGTPDVVLAGSSFSQGAFDPGFLGAALQSEVLNVSVGAGGAKLALESYLTGDSYAGRKPKVLVWEWAAYTGALSSTAQRQFIGATHGLCTGSATKFEGVTSVRDGAVTQLDPPYLDPARHYLSFSFDDLSLLSFDVTLRYQNGGEETLEFRRGERIAKSNRGRYFATLAGDGSSLTSLEFGFPEGGRGSVSVQLCEAPS
jgi:alginate biosynthesis protein AlgX